MSMSPIFQTLDSASDLGLYSISDLDLDLFPSEITGLKRSPGHQSVTSDYSMEEGLSPLRSDIDLESVDFTKLMETENDEDLFSYFITGEDKEEPEEEIVEILDVASPGSCSTVSSAQDLLMPLSEPRRAKTVCVKIVNPVTTRSARKKQSTNQTVTFDDGKEFEFTEKNKNAIQARFNRQKKKAYVQGLEESVQYLTKENATMKTQTKELSDDKKSLEGEVEYLKSVLANQSALSNLLKNIDNLQGVNLTTSFATSRKRSTEHDHDYTGSAKRKRTDKPNVGSGGVCLHVAKDNVSLEFCSQCAKMASGGKRPEDP
jgi:regulator of replication initiation timing